MPHTFSRSEGKYCMTSKDTGKRYCYKSSAARKKGIKMHEAFAHGFRPTQVAKK